MNERLITVTVPEVESRADELENDRLVMIGFSGRESLSRLFSFRLELLSKDLHLVPEKFIGQQVTVAIGRGLDREPRYFNGFINRFSAGGTLPGGERAEMYRSYTAQLVPWLWFLTQTTDCRVFNRPPEEKLSILSIIQQVLSECPHSDFTVRNMGRAHQRDVEYCVQYRESDFNFVSRLMERVGIYYYFTHSRSGHQLVLSDSRAGYSPCAEAEANFAGSGGSHREDHITGWEHSYEFVPGKWAHADYNFKAPAMELARDSGQSNASLSGHEEYELFDYPGEFDNTADGEREAGVRMQEIEVGHNVAAGASTCRPFSAGHCFKLTGYAGEEGGYLLTSVHHSARQPGPRAGSGGEMYYSNSFACIPDRVLFRAPRVTPKPVISGVQTALVVGPPNEEIHCDRFGRVRVRFHWDRLGRAETGNQNTCWIRVANQVAGKRWGFMSLPRVGQEVVVDFEEGDPDRPLIVGSLYNQQQMPHYDLPQHKAKTYVKTNSTPGGDGFNEIMFDDAAGRERLFLHAQNSLDVQVLGDSREHVHGSEHRIIGSEQNGAGHLTELLHGDRQLTVNGGHVEHVHGYYSLQVGYGQSDAPGAGTMDVVIASKERKRVGGDGQHLIIDGDRNLEVCGKLSATIGGDHHASIGGSYALETGGLGEVYVKAGMNVVIEAGAQLTIKSGSNFISITPNGIDIKGTVVNINNGGSAGSGKLPDAAPPEEPLDADPDRPDQPWNSTTGFPSNV